MSPRRVAGRRAASHLVAVAASKTSSYEGVARSLDVSDARVGQWADPTDNAAAMTLGDILAARSDFTIDVLESALTFAKARRDR